MKATSPALSFLLSSSLILTCSTALGVEHPDGSFATPDDGDSVWVSFKHLDNTNDDDYPYGAFQLSSTACPPSGATSCVTECGGISQKGAATLTSVPTSDIPVTDLVFNTEGVHLNDSTSNFCAVLDGAGNVWAIDRDLPTLPNITNANASSRIIPCKISDIFSPNSGCRPPAVFSIEGFVKLDTTEGSAPADGLCSETGHNGRMVVDDINDLLYVCTGSGWKVTSLIPPP